MAGKNWQASSKNSLATALAYLAAGALAPARAQSASDAVQSSAVASLDPGLLWEILIGGILVVSLLGAGAIWVVSMLRRLRRAQLRRNVFVSSALNRLNQGVVMTDPRGRVVFCNDQYLHIYGLTRADVTRNMTGPQLLQMRRQKGILDVSDDDFYHRAAEPEGLVTELPDGRSVLVKYFTLPNGGSVATHLDCTEQRKLSRKLSSTTHFLESVLDNVPVCVAAKSIGDGRYIFANRAFERFSRYPRHHIVGKRAEEIFSPASAAAIIEADETALRAPDGCYRSEFQVERGSRKRVLASNRVAVRNEKGEPEFLIALFEDVTDRRSLSRELENTKKFLELVVDNIPVALIV